MNDPDEAAVLAIERKILRLARLKLRAADDVARVEQAVRDAEMALSGVADVVITPPACGQICVSVSATGGCGVNGGKVQGATVTVTKAGFSAACTTNGVGACCVPITEAGTYTVTIAAPRFTTATRTVSATCATNSLSVSLSPASGFVCPSCGGCDSPIPQNLFVTTSAGTLAITPNGVTVCQNVSRTDICSAGTLTCSGFLTTIMVPTSGNTTVQLALSCGLGGTFQLGVTVGYTVGPISCDPTDHALMAQASGNCNSPWVACHAPLFPVNTTGPTVTLSGTCSGGVLNISGTIPNTVTGAGGVVVPVPVAGTVTVTS